MNPLASLHVCLTCRQTIIANTDGSCPVCGSVDQVALDRLSPWLEEWYEERLSQSVKEWRKGRQA